MAATLLLAALACGDDDGEPGTGDEAPEDVPGAAGIRISRDGGVAILPDGAVVTVEVDAGPPPSPWLDCESQYDDADGGVDPFVDPCILDEDHGVFVDPGATGTAADGSRDHPYASLATAIARAVRDGKAVYACAGVYAEPMRIATELSDGLRVYGGISCETFQPEPNVRSIVRAEGGGAALLVADTRDVRIAHFELESGPGDAPSPGATYIGGYIERAQDVVLEDVVLRAAPGEDGADGAPADGDAADGNDGITGGDACSASPNPGPSLVSNTQCSFTWTNGGTGGDGGLGLGNGGSGTWQGFTNGGVGESGVGWSCDPGVGGALVRPAGFDGGLGFGARGFGALVGGKFTGFSGQRGQPGQHGTGGGGGGGARAPASCSGLAEASGAAGGGGGSGGCGGLGGNGGRPGGSSFALVMLNADVFMRRGALEYGDGGDGGDGAMGQLGGKGGTGGDGGDGSGGSSDACPGADGGDGGRGGPGGGGGGGHAIGVLHVGDPPRLVDVIGEEAASDHTGGAGGGPPEEAGIDTTVQPNVIGSDGVSLFIRPL